VYFFGGVFKAQHFEAIDIPTVLALPIKQKKSANLSVSAFFTTR
jgi:hypothetical protein